MSLCWFFRNFTNLGLKLFCWASFSVKKNRCCAWLRMVSGWTNLKTWLPLSLKVSTPLVFSPQCLYIYLTQVLTKLHCSKLKTFVPAGFSRDHSKFEKFVEVPEEPYGILAEETAGHHQWTGQPYQVPARGAVHTKGPLWGPVCKYTWGVILSGLHCISVWTFLM
jgi:hypothetical protein